MLVGVGIFVGIIAFLIYTRKKYPYISPEEEAKQLLEASKSDISPYSDGVYDGVHIPREPNELFAQLERIEKKN